MIKTIVHETIKKFDILTAYLDKKIKTKITIPQLSFFFLNGQNLLSKLKNKEYKRSYKGIKK
jgi:hypothetical protein